MPPPSPNRAVLFFTNRGTLRDLMAPVFAQDPGSTFYGVPLQLDVIDATATYLAPSTIGIVDVLPEPMVAIRLCQRLRGNYPDLRLIALVCCPDALIDEDLAALRAAGVDSFLDLYMDEHGLRQAVHRVAYGSVVIHLERVGSRGGAPAALPARALNPMPNQIPHLSPRERAVLRHLANGLTREQMAQAEGINSRTVRRTISDLEHKLNAPTLFLLGMKASQFGLVP